MPILRDARKEIKVSLKTIEGSEIIIKDGLLAGDIEDIYGRNETSDVHKMFLVLAKIIVDWNLTNEEGEKLPITVDNIKLFDIRDLTEIVNKTSFNELGEDCLKKNK
jgi:hypothetical protein